MGFFKDLFIEEVPSKIQLETYEEDNIYCDEVTVSAELDNVNVNTLIEDVYVQNDLFDKTKSIFKIEELINTLPKEMVTATKKTSVLAALGVFGLTVTDVTFDGENRINVLSSILSKIIEDGSKNISEKEAEIENYKKQIASLEKEIADIKTEVSSSENIINSEITRITELIKFIEGGNV